MSDESKMTAKAEATAEKKVPKSHAFPCSSCGNRMVYSPASGNLLCPYCKSESPIESRTVEAPEYLYDPTSETASAPNWEAEGESVLVCPACGAETVSDAVDMTVACPFCGSHYVTEPAPAKPILRPETMVPHMLTREKANELFAKWVRRRYLAPRAFRRANHNADMQGVYLPYFTYDTDLFTTYSGQGGRRRTVSYTVRVNGKTQRRTKTVIDWYPISGTHQLYLDDTPCCASLHADEKLLKKIEPFSTKVLKVYNPAYLAGFVAERYTLGLKQGFDRIRPLAESRMESAIKSSRGYDTYRGMRYGHEYRKITFKHILLPVWLSSYRYREKAYSFMVNGESGKVAGRAPLSALKIAMLVTGGIALFALLVYLLMLSGDSSLLISPPDVAALPAPPTDVAGYLPSL